jgi:eukaryotic-like serine/threonine-protein kinase
MTQLGKYQLLRRIGRGGMGEVWLAVQQGPAGFKRAAVVKRLLESLTAETEFLTMFLEEARLAAQIHHPNVVSVYDFEKEGETYFMAMEYVHGVTLRALLKILKTKGEPISQAALVTICAQALEGLGAAHELPGEHGPLGIVHRDVSPDNIMIGFDGLVKVVDFGVAKASTSISTTREGTLKGKMAYVAPEAVLGQEADARTDLWGMGVVMYEALARERPFSGPNDAALCSAIVWSEPVPLYQLTAGMSPGLEAVVLKALSKKPDDRPPNARSFAQSLLSLSDLTPMNQRALGEYVRERADSENILTPSHVLSLANTTDQEAEIVIEDTSVMQSAAVVTPALSSARHDTPRNRRGALVVGALGLVMLGTCGLWKITRPTPVVAPPLVAKNPALRSLDAGPRKEPTLVAIVPDVEVDFPDAGTAAALVKVPVAVPPIEKKDDRPGFLSVRINPWAEVTIDGKSRGSTPFSPVPLRPGMHTVVLVNPDLQKTVTKRVRIEPNRTYPLQVDLMK